MKSLKAQNHPLSNSQYELELLECSYGGISFIQKLEESQMYPLKPTQIDTLQINMGKMCNQLCQHCHVDAGPDRKEIMTKETMIDCLKVIKNNNFKSIDLTGGAPEMNPEFRWFVSELRSIGKDLNIIVRCNLTIILANKKYYDLPEFFKENRVEIISSLPYFSASKTDAQRGDGVFERSIKAMKMLNDVGFGVDGSDLILNLVYNPSGAFLPGSQEGLTFEFKNKLGNNFGISFNKLYAITNIPISRFLDYLIRSSNYAGYMEKLIESYNPYAAANVMCRTTLSVGWDGYLYDCDFNQMLDLKVETPNCKHIKDWDQLILKNRNIVVNQHCFGCTAGSGSSCGGATA